MKTYIAVDPGQAGGVARIMVSSDDRYHVETWNMPETEKDIADLFKEISKGLDVKAIIERVNAFPGQGVVSVWKFSANYHGCRMAMICAGLSFDQVGPLQWQKELGIPSRKKEETKVQHKNKLKAKAQQLFPSVKVTLANADALLLAHYLKKTS